MCISLIEERNVDVRWIVLQDFLERAWKEIDIIICTISHTIKIIEPVECLRYKHIFIAIK